MDNNKYIFWYKREVTAKDHREAVKKESKFPIKFDSLVEEKQSSRRKEDCMGFVCYDDEEEFED